MQNVLKFLKKLDTPLTYAIASLVAGLAFLLLPTLVLDILLVATGACVTLLAILHLAIDLAERGARPFLMLEVIRDIMFAVVGVSLCVLRSDISDTVCRLLGGIITLYTLFRLYKLSGVTEHERAWWAELIITIVIAVFGAWLMLFPVYSQIMTGVALLIVGAKFFIEAWKRKAPKKPKGGTDDNGDYYTDDFVDKT